MTGRRAVQALMRRITMLAHPWPRLTLRGADLLAPAMRRLRRVPSAADLRRVFGHLDAAGAEALRKRMLREEMRREVLVTWLLTGGRARVRRLLQNRGPLRLPPPPLILATFHIGPVHALGAVIESQPAPLLALAKATFVRDGFSDEQNRVAAFYEATRVLQRGGLVLMAVDPDDATWIRVPFFGGTLPLARGAFALARATGAPIVPLAARWSGTSIDVVVGEPLTAAGADAEQSLAASIARWLEDYLRQHPEEISPRIVNMMEP
jgi:lauroyl/myristoyl acyltransferase